MMKYGVTAAALAGLAASASAQSLTIRVDATKTVVNPGEIVNWTVTASFSGGEFSYFNAINANFLHQGDATGANSSFLGLNSWANPALGAPNGGQALGLSMVGVYGAQQALFGAVDSSKPFVIGGFQTAYNGVYPADETFSTYNVTQQGTNAAFAVTFADTEAGQTTNAPTEYFNGDFELISDTITVLPTPGAVAMLGLGGLVATRRRR